VFRDNTLTPEARQLAAPQLPGPCVQVVLQHDKTKLHAFIWKFKRCFLIESTSPEWAEDALRFFVEDGQIKEIL
jgi:hypothetical protein